MFIECEMSVLKESQSVPMLAVSFGFVAEVNTNPLSREEPPIQVLRIHNN